MTSKTKSAALLVASFGVVAVVIAGCGSGDDAQAGAASDSSSLPQGSEPANLDPAEFTTTIDNPYWPMSPGSRWTYRELDGRSVLKVVVKVTDRTKTVDGIEARVVSDVVSEAGVPIEVTDDYYAQDSAGNIWYLGEDTTEYENGKPASTSGSFLAGIDGAEAGVALPADPQVGMQYRQEYYAGEAEDEGEVLSVDQEVEVPFGHFKGALLTEDTNPLEPRVSEHKFYARGVGPVLTLDISGGSGREDLLSYTARELSRRRAFGTRPAPPPRVGRISPAGPEFSAPPIAGEAGCQSPRGWRTAKPPWRSLVRLHPGPSPAVIEVSRRSPAITAYMWPPFA